MFIYFQYYKLHYIKQWFQSDKYNDNDNDNDNENSLF